MLFDVCAKSGLDFEHSTGCLIEIQKVIILEHSTRFLMGISKVFILGFLKAYSKAFKKYSKALEHSTRFLMGISKVFILGFSPNDLVQNNETPDARYQIKN